MGEIGKVIQEVKKLYILASVATAQDLNSLQKAMKKSWDRLMSEQLWELIFLASIKISLILLVSWFVVIVGKKIIANIFKLRMKSPLHYSERRQKTILRLLQSVLSYIVYFSAIIGVLSSVNINVAGLLAGAGIAGLAIGFGAQSLVKDIISGFFIIFEDQFGVGDYIKLNNAEGRVKEIGLRTTKIQGATGEQHIIPNGSIGVVVNYSVNDTSANIDFVVPVAANLREIENAVNNYLTGLVNTYEELTKDPVLMGVQSFTPDNVTLRIKIETASMEHSKISRLIRKDLLELLEKYGVTME